MQSAKIDCIQSIVICGQNQPVSYRRFNLAKNWNSISEKSPKLQKKLFEKSFQLDITKKNRFGLMDSSKQRSWIKTKICQLRN